LSFKNRSHLSCLFKNPSTSEKGSDRVSAALRIFLPIFVLTVILVISNQATFAHAQSENGGLSGDTPNIDAKMDLIY